MLERVGEAVDSLTMKGCYSFHQHQLSDAETRCVTMVIICYIIQYENDVQIFNLFYLLLLVR